jgi:hypothetical protein
MNDQPRSTKAAELLAGVGAVVFGVGLGLLFRESLGPFAVPILVVGGVAHAWGMFAKHRQERARPGGRVWWAELSYWACWAALFILGAYVLVKKATE